MKKMNVKKFVAFIMMLSVLVSIHSEVFALTLSALSPVDVNTENQSLTNTSAFNDDTLIVGKPDGYFYDESESFLEYTSELLTSSSSQLTISSDGIDFIIAREGFHSTCYKDGTQSSIGYGTKCGTSVHESGLHSITREQARADMISQINNRYAPVVRKQTVGIDMNQNQFDALVSLAYNTGGGTDIISTSPLVKYLKGELSESSARDLYSKYYIKSSGVVLQGLINRRNAEADFFFKDCFVSPEIRVSDLSAPSIITTGENFRLSGTVRSDMNLTYASLRVVDADFNGEWGTWEIAVDYEPDGKSLDLSVLPVDFGTLSPGVYKLTLTVANTDHTDTIIDVILTVLSREETVENGTYIFRSAQNNSYAIGITNNNIELQSYANEADRTWYVEYLENGYYTIRNCYTGLYLDVYNGSSEPDSNVWQHEGNQSFAQQWQILQSGRTYCLVPRCATSCSIDIANWEMIVGTNILIYTSHLGTNQRFSLEQSNCDFQTGHKITFNTNGGLLPSASYVYTANGINTGRGSGELIIYNVPNSTVMTNSYGNEVKVDNTGKVVAVRGYDDNNRLVVPYGGMVVSGHLNNGNDGAAFVDKIKSGYYVGFDYSKRKVYVYISENGYLSNHKYVENDAAYGSLPTPSKNGYKFDGWYTSLTGGTKITSNSTYTANTLYAHWVAEDVNVVKISTTTFPDDNFRNYVLNKCDTNCDGYLSDGEINNVTSIDVSSMNIANMQGLEYFLNLTDLSCGNNKINSINLDKNYKLTFLDCHENNIEKLDLRSTPQLSNLWCHKNKLVCLDLSGTNCKTASVWYGKYNIGNVGDVFYLSNLSKYGFDPSKASNWVGAIYNSSNNSLSDFTSTTITYDYDCGNGAILNFRIQADSVPENSFIEINSTTFPDDAFRNYVINNIDIDGNNKLTTTEIINTTRIETDHLRVNNIRNLKGIEYFPNLVYLDCEYNELQTLDVSKNLKLEKLLCGCNQLNKLDVSKNTKLITLDCMENQLTELNVDNNKELVLLDCDYNQISALNVSKNTKLKTLHCYRNNISYIDLSNNAELVDVNINNCPITTLDLSNNTKIKYLVCTGSKLKSLDLSKNLLLERLYCSRTCLTSINISNNINLDTFICDDNKLSIGTVTGSYSLSNLAKYGFDSTKVINWIGATYDYSSNSLIDFTSNTVMYNYSCGNGIIQTFTLVADKYIPTIEISTQPVDVTIAEGLNVTFSVVAKGLGLQYQWQVNDGFGWKNLQGETKSSIVIKSSTGSMDHNEYRCFIFNSSGGTQTSEIAQLYVIPVGKVSVTTVNGMSIDECIAFVNYFSNNSVENTIPLTSAQMLAIERVLEYDYSK